MILFVFFFEENADSRILHSFPTRRSSDLQQSSRCTTSKTVSTNCRSEIGKRASSSRDRKSTRLNSSHRCSSYAVFCLKKKTKQYILKIVVSSLYVSRLEVSSRWLLKTVND